MPGQDIRIPSSEGNQFDVYCVTPDAAAKVPAIVLAPAVHGVDQDIRAIADTFGAKGYIALALDLFWRTIPGPLPREDKRAAERAQPRLERIRTGEKDLADALAALRKMPLFNGKAAVMGFCYGGPYALIGPKRLGYAAGISCHGTQMLDYIQELEGMTQPVCIIWGDQDHAAPPPVQSAYQAVAEKMPHLELHIFPGVLHGYMMPGNPKAFHAETRDFSMSRALAILNGLRTLTAQEPMRKAG